MIGTVIKAEYPILKQLAEKWEMEAAIYEEISERKKAAGDEHGAIWFESRAAELNFRLMELYGMKEIKERGEIKAFDTDDIEALVDKIVERLGGEL